MLPPCLPLLPLRAAWSSCHHQLPLAGLCLTCPSLTWLSSYVQPLMLSHMLITHVSQVACHGPAFEGYSAAIVGSSFGGNVIDMLDLNDVTQFMETMGISTQHKLVLKATFAGWKRNPDSAFEALAAAKVALAV